MNLHIAHATINLTVPADALICNQLLAGVDTLPPDARASADSAALTPPAHGEYWTGQGGHYICTQPALLGLPARHLIFGAGEIDDLTFGPQLDVLDARSQLDGKSNTAALLAAHRDHAAAKWASEYQADGHADFHLPSRMDLLMAYVCAPKLFKTSGWYWSSTQLSRNGAFVQDFEYGYSYWLGKDYERRVRACRWIHLNA